MDLKQLMEAATRFNDGRLCEHATKVADAFLNPDPVTRSGLEAMGAFSGPARDDVMILPTRKKWCLAFFFLENGLMVKEREIVDGDPGGGWKAPLNPQPETMGDVCFLIYRLSRTGV